MAEKQKEMYKKAKEFEQKELDKLFQKKGCPIKTAESKFFDHLLKTREERKEKYKALESIVLP